MGLSDADFGRIKNLLEDVVVRTNHKDEAPSGSDRVKKLLGRDAAYAEPHLSGGQKVPR